MADEVLQRDQNHIVVLGAVTDNAAQEIRMLRVDPTTKRLLVSATGGGGTPGGSDTQIQFNDGGSFGGDASFTWDKTLNLLTIGNILISSANDIPYSSGQKAAVILDDTNGVQLAFNGSAGATDNGLGISLFGNDGGATSGVGGAISFYAGSAQGGDSAGGALNFTSGNGFGSEAGGRFDFIGGTGGATGAGGFLNFAAGLGGATSGDGGALSFAAGDAQGGDSDGGSITFDAGSKTGAGVNGQIAMFEGGGNIGLAISDTDGFEIFAGGTQSAILSTASIASSSKTFTFPNQTGTLMVAVSAPATAASAGVAGTYAFDASFFYVCIATNTWKRVAIATW